VIGVVLDVPGCKDFKIALSAEKENSTRLVTVEGYKVPVHIAKTKSNA